MGGEARVQFLHADGNDSLWLSNGVSRRPSPSSKGGGRFVALELPEDGVLRREISLPDMAEADVHDAVHLLAQDVSPFARDDLDWAYAVKAGAAAQLHVELALASRRQVVAFIQASEDRLARHQSPLVWVRTQSSHNPGQVIEFTAYGDNKVQALGRQKRWVALALLAVAAALGAGILATPTFKLRMQAIEANHAYYKKQTETSGLSQQRSDLVLLSEKIAAIKTVTADAIDAPRLLSQLTQLLPDDTYLVSLSVQGRKVSLYGQTPNAAALMQLLSNQKGFLEVKAPIAAIRPSGGSKDTFTIDFQLAPGLLSAVQSAASVEAPAVANAASGAPATPAATALSATATATPTTPTTPTANTTTVVSPKASAPVATGAVPVPNAAGFGGGASFGGVAPAAGGKKP